MKIKLAAAAIALATAASMSTSASALSLGLDTGWQPFSFGDVGSSWSDDFTFTIAGPAYFAVTDAYCAGDLFAFAVNGTNIGNTSVPFYDGTCNDGTTRTTDPAFAYSSSLWSHGEIMLGAGTYTITGTTVLSPFGGGGAFAQLSSRSLGGPGIGAVPVPAAGVLLLTAFGGFAALRRRKTA